MKQIFLVIAAAVFLLLIPSTSFACSCASQTPPVAFNGANAVFIGRMLGGTEKIWQRDENGKAYLIEAGEVSFKVEKVFKGKLAKEIIVLVWSARGSSCGDYGLTRGERYVVYAYTDEEGKNLYTGVCTHTGKVSSEYTKDDLVFLQNLPPKGTGGNLRGRMWIYLKGEGARLIVDAKVNISSSDNKIITVLTNEEGRFEVTGLKPGKYKVEPIIPKGYSTERAFEEVEIDDRGTADVSFEVFINSKISGRVVDKNGQIYTKPFLQLEGEGKAFGIDSTEENGVFEFEQIPPGEYILYLPMQGNDNSIQKNYYYPGTYNYEEAETIKIGLGEKLEDLEFRLPYEFLVRTIEGQVMWTDGTPAANVEVELRCPQSANPDGFAIEFRPLTTKTNEQGRFKFEGLVSDVYTLEAHGYKESDVKGKFIGLHSPLRKIVLNENLEDIKVALSENGFYSFGCGN